MHLNRIGNNCYENHSLYYVTLNNNHLTWEGPFVTCVWRYCCSTTRIPLWKHLSETFLPPVSLCLERLFVYFRRISLTATSCSCSELEKDWNKLTKSLAIKSPKFQYLLLSMTFQRMWIVTVSLARRLSPAAAVHSPDKHHFPVLKLLPEQQISPIFSALECIGVGCVNGVRKVLKIYVPFFYYDSIMIKNLFDLKWLQILRKN